MSPDPHEHHWLSHRYPVPSGWIYVCGCSHEFKAGFEDDAHRQFMDHLVEHDGRDR